MKTYTVTIQFRYPPWDEKNGIAYHDVKARNKSEAIRQIRKQANNDGHLCRFKGKTTYVAQEVA